MRLTILICTFNRATILNDCLRSFTKQTVSLNHFEVLIINNNSTDNTQNIIERYSNKYSNFKYVFEPKQGLSYARNRGYQEAETKWVAYIDDDAKAYPNYVERVLWVIENFDFDCFGGMSYGWFKDKKPKWLSKEFGTHALLLNKIGKLNSGAFAGCNLLVKKAALKNVGGFKTDLGMNGSKIGYGEDNEIILKLRDKRYVIGFDPKLKVDHLVMSHKYSIWWHLWSKYISGKTTQKITPSTFGQLFYEVSRSFLSIFLRKIPTNLFKLAFFSDYYWQNLILDTLSIFIFRIGKLMTYLEN